MPISHTARNRMQARHHLDAEMESARPTNDRSLVNDDSISHTARNRVHARHHLDAEMESARPTDDRSLVNDDTTSTCTTAENMQSDLYMAAKRGNTDFIKKKMEDMERSLAIQRSPKLNTILHIAASSGHDQLVEAILESHTNLQQCQNLAGDLPLHVAVRVGHLPMVKKLAISSEEFISSTDLLMEQNDERNTPLHLALIKKYKEVDRRNLVLKSRYSEIANFLVETEPEVSLFLNKEEESPLYMAAEAGDAELVKLMLEKGVGSPGFPVPAGKSIVHAAITGKNIDVLHIILSLDLDRILGIHPHSITDDKGMTPLSYAASIGYLDGVRYLLNKSTYESDQKGFFPIHWASSKGHIKVIQEFLQRCPDSVELLNHKGRNILHVAAMSGKAKVVNYMLKMPELEMLINEKDDDGNTSLHLASMNGHPKVVSILTWDKRVDLNLLNKDGKTALDIAGKYSGKVPSFQEQLTWVALRYADTPHAPRPSTTGGNRQSSKPREAPSTENYKDRVNTLMLVATLVVTVTFAAGFTVPGGNNDSEPHVGMAKFLLRHMFHVFTVSNTIAMYSSVTVAVVLIWAQLGDLNLVIASLKLAVPILGLALTMVSLAFMTGSYLIVRDVHWLASFVLVIGSFFILTLTILFIPLCLPSSLPHPIFRYIVYYPFCLLIIVTRSNPNDKEEK